MRCRQERHSILNPLSLLEVVKVMDVSIEEVCCFVLLFAIPAILVMVTGFAGILVYSVIKRLRYRLLFHWLDFLVPIIVTILWLGLQSFSLQTKSFGNFSELSILGLVWGGLFICRGIFAIKGKGSSIWYFVLWECLITVVLVLLAPTFPE